MNYSYNTNNGKINTFISFESWNDRVSIYPKNSDKTVETQLYNTDSGDLVFDYQGQQVNFLDFNKISMADIRDMVAAGEHICDSDLMQAIICDGINNVRFSVDMPVPEMLIPMMGISVYGDKTKRFTCKIKEGSQDHPHTNYKLEICVVDEENPNHLVGSRRFYTSDFTSMIRTGRVEILDSLDDGKTADSHVQEYFSSITKGKFYDYKVKALEVV